MSVPANRVSANRVSGIGASATGVSSLEHLLNDLTVSRYRAWLDEAYHATTSDSIRTLISELAQEVRSLVATGVDFLDGFNEVIVGALESVAVAMRIEAQAGISG